MILRGRLQLAPPLFYVATKAKKPVLNEVLVKHDNITDIPTYLHYVVDHINASNHRSTPVWAQSSSIALSATSKCGSCGAGPAPTDG